MTEIAASLYRSLQQSELKTKEPGVSHVASRVSFAKGKKTVSLAEVSVFEACVDISCSDDRACVTGNQLIINKKRRIHLRKRKKNPKSKTLNLTPVLH